MAHVKKTQAQHHFRHNTTYKPPFSKNRRVRILFFSFFFNLGLICFHYMKIVFRINWILNDWLMMDDLQTTFFAIMFYLCGILEFLCFV